MKINILTGTLLIFSLVNSCDVFAEFNNYAENDYDYKNVCPGGGYVYDKCIDKNKDGVYDNRPCDGWSDRHEGFYFDRWMFAQCNCTSYTAYRMDSQLRYATANDLSFDNGYLGRSWGSGKDWDDAARKVGISVDSIPIPGDIAYWDAGSEKAQKYGHVAYIEHVTYDDDMNWTEICLSEYNIKPEYYSSRCIKRGVLRGV
jgi:surface antigen